MAPGLKHRIWYFRTLSAVGSKSPESCPNDHQVIDQTDYKRACQWPVKKIHPRPVADGLYFACFQTIERIVDTLELLPVAGKEVFAAGCGGHFLKCRFIQLFLAGAGWVAHGHGVQDDALVRGDPCGVGGRHPAAGVVAVGECNDDPLFHFAALERCPKAAGPA